MTMQLYNVFGWMFVALSAVFAVGVFKPFARHFYPGLPGDWRVGWRRR